MNKITESLKQNLEMTAFEVARIEVRKVPDPTVRAGLETLVDLLDHVINNQAPTEPAPPLDHVAPGCEPNAGT